MKSSSKFILLLAAIAGFGWLGCQAQTAPITAYTAPYTVVDQSVLTNFEAGNVNINPQLFEVGTPGNVLVLPGTVQVVNNFHGSEAATLVVMGPGANNTALACNVSGAVTDKGDGTYPAVDLQVPMESGNKYNMSFFSGVKFYYKIGTDDTVAKRVFQIPTFQTQGVPAGGCLTSCYDHFGTTLASTNGAWQLFSIKFTGLTRAGFGAPLTPNSLSGNNLTQVLWLLWEEGNNNTAGTATVDFWVDEIQFF